MNDLSTLFSLFVGVVVLVAFGGFLSVLWRVQRQHQALMEGLASLARGRGWSFDVDGDADCFYRLFGRWSDGHAWLLEGVREDVAVEGLRVSFQIPVTLGCSFLLVPRHQDAWVFDPAHVLLPSALEAALGGSIDPTTMHYLSVAPSNMSSHYLILSDNPLFLQRKKASLSALEELFDFWTQRFSIDQLPLLSAHAGTATLRFLVPVQDAETLLVLLAFARRWLSFLVESVETSG